MLYVMANASYSVIMVYLIYKKERILVYYPRSPRFFDGSKSRHTVITTLVWIVTRPERGRRKGLVAIVCACA